MWEKILINIHRITLQYQCGHRCTENCHPGPCPHPELCKKKVKVMCLCKLRKVDISCEKLRQGFELSCDDTCKSKLEARQLVEEELRKERAAAEEERDRIEMEEYQKKYGQKKPKERRQRQTDVKEDRNWKRIMIVLGIFIPLIGIISFIGFNSL